MLRNKTNQMDIEESGHGSSSPTPSKCVDKKRTRRRRNRHPRRQQPIHHHQHPMNSNSCMVNMADYSKVSLAHLPKEILLKIFGYCDRPSLQALSSSLTWFGTFIAQEGLLWESPPKLNLDELPSELLLKIFGYLSRADIGRVAVVCQRFSALTQAECLWIKDARKCLVTNGLHQGFVSRNFIPMTAQDRVKISKNWSEGHYHETTIIVQAIRYMPRLQLEESALWVSWGNKIWSHPRQKGGAISRTTNRVLKGHTDDVDRFVVKNGIVVSGGHDQSLFGWNAATGEFAFAKRYCHAGEVSAVDVAGGGSVVVSGSRDRTVKIWSLMRNNDNSSFNNNDFINNRVNSNRENLNNQQNNNGGGVIMSSSLPVLAGTIDIGDRIWSLSTDPVSSSVAIGSAGLCGVPSLHLLDLSTGMVTMELGHNLKRGAGMLDLGWLSQSTFLSCGYDSCTRLWDTRIGNCVRSWEEPFNEAIYCLSTDQNMTLICGTARHGLVRLWDMRHKDPVQMIYTKHAYAGQSSPVYSVDFDMSYLYVAQDQCLSLVAFDGANDSNNSNSNIISSGSNNRSLRHYR